MGLGYIGINMPRHYRHKFCVLMAEAGYTFISLDELRIHLGAVLISSERKAITEGTLNPEYIHWDGDLQASLELLNPDARMPFIRETCLSYEQTQLSS